MLIILLQHNDDLYHIINNFYDDKNYLLLLLLKHILNKVFLIYGAYTILQILIIKSEFYSIKENIV